MAIAATNVVNELVIHPVRPESTGEFAEQILAELIQEGYSGQKLLFEFKNRQAGVRPAIAKMLEEAEKAAMDEAEYETVDSVFGDRL